MLGAGDAWEVGVIEALESSVAFRAAEVDVVKGTPVGAMVSAYAALGWSFADRTAAERAGQGFTTPG